MTPESGALNTVGVTGVMLDDSYKDGTTETSASIGRQSDGGFNVLSVLGSALVVNYMSSERSSHDAEGRTSSRVLWPSLESSGRKAGVGRLTRRPFERRLRW